MSSQQKAGIKQNPNPPKPRFSKTEFIFKTSFFVVIFLAAWLSKKLYQFRNEPGNQQILYGQFKKLLWCLPLAAIIHIVRQSVIRFFKPKLFPITQISDPSKKDERAARLGRWIFDITYMLSMSIIAIIVLKDHQSFPRLVDGWPTSLNVLKRSISEKFLFGFELLYILELSSYFQSLIYHSHQLFTVPGKSYEFLLHDGMTVFLIAYSYLFSVWTVGIVTMFLHDFSDVAIFIGRFYNGITVRNQFLFNFLVVFTFATWIGCRIILFPLLCIIPLYKMQNRPFELTVFCYLLSGLYCMHVYWTYMMYASLTNSKRRRQSTEY